MALHGPITISANLQFRLPVRLARMLHVEAGDEFYARVSDDDPGVITLLPSEVVERRYSIGERLERGMNERGEELGEPSQVQADLDQDPGQQQTATD